jgi:hypothetical protein
MPKCKLWAPGKLTYPLSANANVLSATFCTPTPPAGTTLTYILGQKVAPLMYILGRKQWKVAGSMLALAESGYVHLPGP